MTRLRGLHPWIHKQMDDCIDRVVQHFLRAKQTRTGFAKIQRNRGRSRSNVLPPLHENQCVFTMSNLQFPVT